MRSPRHLSLSQSGGVVHEFWRAHNREYLLRTPESRSLYLSCVTKALRHKSVKGEVSVSAYCVMSNHVHMVTHYTKLSESLSNFMRVGHTRFGQVFNKIHKRQGPVAYDRPKTPLVQEQVWNLMRVHFYVEANPLRAGMVKDLKLYKHSSFRFYAWGIRDEFSRQLQEPEWYKALGVTAKARQSRYRSLFDKYLRELVMKRLSFFTRGRYIGDPLWMSSKETTYGALLKSRRSRKDMGSDPPILVV